MPLILCTIFFVLLFSCEFFLYTARVDEEQRRLQRYHQVEHPRFCRSDSYIDASPR